MDVKWAKYSSDSWRCQAKLHGLSSSCFFSVCKALGVFSYSNSSHLIQTPLWIDCWYKAPLVPAELRRREAPMSSTNYAKDLHGMSLSFVASLKACGKKKDLQEVCRLHADIRMCGLLNTSIYLGNMLISLYAKCLALTQAREVLLELPLRDVVSWSALISGYAQNGQGKEALECYAHMLSEGLSPDAITYSCVLKACGITQDIDKGKQIHHEIIRQGLLGGNVVLGSALVDMYAKCGFVMKAQEVFDELPERNIVSWSALIAGYTQCGQGFEALSCFQRMRSHGLSPCSITYSCILKACGITKALDLGESIHEEVVSEGLLGKNVVVGTALVDMYAKCGALSKAQRVLDELPVRTVVSWNALIGGHVQKEEGEEAIECYERMQKEGVSPDARTYMCILKACGMMRALDRGKNFHDEIVNLGLLAGSLVLGNALIDMYVACGMLSIAQQVLNELPERDVVSWSTLIAGYAQNRQGEEAFLCFERLQREGLSPNAITYNGILMACSMTGNSQMGKEIHAEIVCKGLLAGNNVVLGNTLVNMYGKGSLFSEAKHVLLRELLVRNVASWNALISGYAKHEQGEEILHSYGQMQCQGVSPDAITYACFLKACGITKELDRGRDIHNEIVSEGLLEKSGVLGNALVDMYAKCGMLNRAHQVLEELPTRNVISWSALIGGYAQHGQAKEALECFLQMQSEGLSPDIASWNALIGGYAQQGQSKEALSCFYWMLREGVSPDVITLVCVLNACSHSGLIDKGQSYFENMSRDYGIIPDIEHHSCMMNLYARAGHFDRAMNMMRKMPFSNYPPIWSAVLGACQNSGNVTLGHIAFRYVVQ